MTTRRKPTPATEAEPLVAMVPLSALYLHDFNTRSEPPPADIEALADSIRAIGLLQNLSGFDDAPDDPAGMIGIVAGGRRLRALRLIAGDSDPMVPVRITTDEATARLWASAENTARMALHPADEIAAYGRMADTGADPNAIARAFAVTEAHVRRRLKLAGLPGPALSALRDNRISLDQAAALTVARTAEDAERVLGEVLASRFPIESREIRARLQQATVPATDRRAVFVGLEMYRALGGELQADLFTDQTRLLDLDLLDRLFAERLEAEAALQRACGWKWVQTMAESYVSYDTSAKLTRIRRVPVDLPSADADELVRLGETTAFTPAQQERYDELIARAAGDYAEADIATSGVFLYVDNSGQLRVSDPYRRPEDDPARAAQTAADTATARPVETKALPAALTEDLRRIRRLALEVELLDCPGLMLDLLAFTLQGGHYGHETPVVIDLTAAPFAPEKPDGLDVPQRLAEFHSARNGARTPVTVEAFKAFRTMSPTASGLAVPTAITLAAVRCLRPGSPLEAYAASLVTPRPRAIWTPTRDGYLSRLPVPVLDAIWAELVPTDKAPPTWSDLKKAQKAAELHDLFNSADYREALGLSRAESERIDTWTPPELQWPEVEA